MRRVRDLRRAARDHRRTHRRISRTCCKTRPYGRLQQSVRPIIPPTEGAAWDKANRILADMTGKLGWARQEGVRAPVDNAGRRQFAFAKKKDVHDKRLWMGITKATGALGNTSCLVGTAEQVADAILGYYRLGVASFLIRGFEPVADTTEFGRDLIPRIKAGALEIDRLIVAPGAA